MPNRPAPEHGAQFVTGRAFVDQGLDVVSAAQYAGLQLAEDDSPAGMPR